MQNIKYLCTMKKARFLIALLSLLSIAGCDNNKEEPVYRIETFKGGNFQLNLKEFEYGLNYYADKNSESIRLIYTIHSDFDQIKELEHYLGSYNVIFDEDQSRGSFDGINGLHPSSIAPDETVTISMTLHAFKDWKSFIVSYKSKDINYRFIMNKSDYPNSQVSS